MGRVGIDAWEHQRVVVPVAPPEGVSEVWALDGSAWRRVAGPLAPGEAADELKRWAHVPAVTARGGTPLQANAHVTQARLAAARAQIRAAHAEAPSNDAAPHDNDHDDEGTMAKTKTTKTKVKRKPAAEPTAEATQETTEAPAACDAHECGAEVGRVRIDTPDEGKGFCRHHRQAMRERASRWGVSYADAAQSLRDGATERPAAAAEEVASDEAPAPKAPKARRTPKTKATRRVTKRAAAARPEPTAPPAGHALTMLRRLTAVVARLGGIDAAESLAGELEQLGAAQ